MLAHTHDQDDGDTPAGPVPAPLYPAETGEPAAGGDGGDQDWPWRRGRDG
ncbi:hypothetical protein ACFY4C_03750 [Actinomadura viridis]